MARLDEDQTMRSSIDRVRAVRLSRPGFALWAGHRLRVLLWRRQQPETVNDPCCRGYGFESAHRHLCIEDSLLLMLSIALSALLSGCESVAHCQTTLIDSGIDGDSAEVHELPYPYIEGFPPQIRALVAKRNASIATAIGQARPKQKRGMSLQSLISTIDRWNPGTTITVAFQGGSYALRKKIAETANDWTRIVDKTLHHPGFSFDFGESPKFREWSEWDDEYTSDIRVAFDHPNPEMRGRWSAVGDQSRRPELDFGPAQPSLMLYSFDRKLPSNWRTIVIHEFGHALGLRHEHQSPRGGCDFRWTEDPGYQTTYEDGDPKKPLTLDSQGKRPSVYQYLGGPFNFWRTDIVDQNLKTLTALNVEASPFDKKSIMLYSLPAILFEKGENSPCFIDTENLTISDNDREAIFRMFPPTIDEAQRVVSRDKSTLVNFLRLPQERNLEAAVEKKQLEMTVDAQNF
jgi:hypothetical protein